MGRGAYFASQSCKGHHGLPFPKWQTELARSAMQTCPWCFGVVNGSTFAAGVMAGRSGWYPLSCTSSPEGQLFNSGVLQTSGRCCRQRFNRLAGVHVPLFRIRIVCFVSPSTAVLVSSCNAKEPRSRRSARRWFFPCRRHHGLTGTGGCWIASPCLRLRERLLVSNLLTQVSRTSLHDDM